MAEQFRDNTLTSLDARILQSQSSPQGGSDGDRTTGSLSWVLQLQTYLKSQSNLNPQRKALADAVLENPTSPDAWLEFLESEEASIVSNSDAAKQNTSSHSRHISLYHLYHKATELVQRGRGKSADCYMKIWLGYARHQWDRNEDEARDTLKTLKNQHIGDSNAYLYYEWAQLEAKAGNISKALGILQKGQKEIAAPSSILEKLKLELQSCNPDLAASTQLTSTRMFTGAHCATPSLDCKHMGVAAHAVDQERSQSHAPHIMTSTADQQHSTADLPFHRPVQAVSSLLKKPPSDGVSAQQQVHQTTHTLHSTSSRSSMGSAHDLSLPLSANTTKSALATSVSSASDEDHTASCRKGDDATSAVTLGGDDLTGNARSHPAGDGTPGLHSSHTHTSTTGLQGNTGTLGIKRFGFKSKALRVTSTSAPVAGATAAATAAVPAEQQEALGAAARAVVAPSTTTSRDPVFQQDDEAAASRKRRADIEVVQPPRSSAGITTDGVKRRSSPETHNGRVGADAAFAAPGPSGAPTLAASAAPLSGAMQASSVQPTIQPGVTTGGSVPSNSWHPTANHCASTPSIPMLEAGTDPSHGQPSALQPSVSHPANASGLPPLAHSSVRAHVPFDASGLPPLGQSSVRAHVPFDAQQGGLGVQGARRPRDENIAPSIPSSDPNSQMQAADKQADALKPASVRPVPPPPMFDGKPSATAMDGREPLQPVLGATAEGGAVPAMRAAPMGATASEQQQRAAPAGDAREPAAAGQAPQATAGSTAPDFRSMPPERLPDPQKRAMEDQHWVYVNGIRYQKLDCVGRGGSSKVYKVLGCNRQIYAMKRVRFQNKDPEAIKGFIDEISLLKQLRNTPNIIQLISAQVFREEGLIYMVLEYGDIDLARLLHNHEEARRKGGGSEGEIDENFIRLYWQQMLQAVKGIHDLRIVHSDLKPANFMLVQGQLKLIDFGIAKSIQGDTTSINRESQVGTLNYMSPEAIQGGSSNPLGGAPMKVGRPSDIWSLGCILYQMIYGRTPFADLPFIPKMNAICNPSYKINLPACSNPAAVDAIKLCLDRDPRTRVTMQELLDHAFLHPERPQHAAAPAPLNLSEDQLKSIVSQIALAGASGTADIDLLTKQVLAQLGGNKIAGASTTYTAVPVQPPAAPQRQASAPAPPPPGPPPPPPMLGSKPPAPPGPPPAPILLAPASKPTAAASSSIPPAPAGAPRPVAPKIAPPVAAGSLANMAAAAAAAAAAKRSAKPSEALEPPKPKAHLPPPGGSVPTGGMLQGAELHAAILQRRNQLKPVAEQPAAPAVPARPAPGAGGGSGEDLQNILRKGLQRMHFDDDTEGNTAFLDAMMEKRS